MYIMKFRLSRGRDTNWKQVIHTCIYIGKLKYTWWNFMYCTVFNFKDTPYVWLLLVTLSLCRYFFSLFLSASSISWLVLSLSRSQRIRATIASVLAWRECTDYPSCFDYFTLTFNVLVATISAKIRNQIDRVSSTYFMFIII